MMLLGLVLFTLCSLGRSAKEPSRDDENMDQDHKPREEPASINDSSSSAEESSGDTLVLASLGDDEPSDTRGRSAQGPRDDEKIDCVAREKPVSNGELLDSTPVPVLAKIFSSAWSRQEAERIAKGWPLLDQALFENPGMFEEATIEVTGAVHKAFNGTYRCRSVEKGLPAVLKHLGWDEDWWGRLCATAARNDVQWCFEKHGAVIWWDERNANEPNSWRMYCYTRAHPDKYRYYSYCEESADPTKVPAAGWKTMRRTGRDLLNPSWSYPSRERPDLQLVGDCVSELQTRAQRSASGPAQAPVPETQTCGCL